MLHCVGNVGYLEFPTRRLPLKIDGDFLARVSLVDLDPLCFDLEHVNFSVIASVLMLLNWLRSLSLKSVLNHGLQAPLFVA